MKKAYVLGMAVLLTAMLALSGVAHSAMWVGAQLGGNFVGASDVSIGGASASTYFKPAVIGGMALGYDFINTGFGAYAWPDWAKYFGVSTDITYNRLNLADLGHSGLGSNVNGYCVTWSFLLRAQYPFMPDSEVPSGRIVPYIAVGPAIMWSGSDFTLPLGDVTRITNSRFSSHQTNIALVVEPGIRWMAMKNISIDTAFRYRYAAPSWDFNGVDVSSTLNQFSFLLRANYHF
jgi:hypothetical protein